MRRFFGKIDGGYYENTGISFRPVVCLKSNVHLVKKISGTTATYELELD